MTRKRKRNYGSVSCFVQSNLIWWPPLNLSTNSWHITSNKHWHSGRL